MARDAPVPGQSKKYMIQAIALGLYGPAVRFVTFKPQSWSTIPTIRKGIMKKKVQEKEMMEKYVDHSIFYEYSDWALRDAVKEVSKKHLLEGSTVEKLTDSLTIRSPIIYWYQSERAIRSLQGNKRQITFLSKIYDPCFVLPYVVWPCNDQRESSYETDEEQQLLTITETVPAQSVDAAMEVFDRHLRRFRKNVARTLTDVERYNAALPYLISVAIGHRLGNSH